MKKIINTQMNPSVAIFPRRLIESNTKDLTDCMRGLLLCLPNVLQSIHSGLGLTKISSRNGINIPMDTIANTTLRRVNKKYNPIFPLYGPRYLKIREYFFITAMYMS